MPRVYVSLGSNIDREHNLRAAIQALREKFGTLAVSTVYESRAVGFDGDNFYNAVAAFDTELDIPSTLAALSAIEESLGRVRGAAKFAPRTIDLDLLLYGDVVMDDGRVRLPREEIERYAFVLRPLAELAPDAMHPARAVTFRALWNTFSKNAAELWPVSNFRHRS